MSSLLLITACAYAGCHINGAAPGDFSSYEGLEVFKEGDEFRRRTLEIMEYATELCSCRSTEVSDPKKN